MTAVIRDSLRPGRRPRQIDLREAPTQLLRQLAASGSREAAREFTRRLRERG
jgi:hypothetical protein